MQGRPVREVARTLLLAGASANALAPKILTPPHVATVRGHLDVAKLLLEWTPLEIGTGILVTIHGLVARPELNGTSGKVTGFTETTGRFGVRLNSGHNLGVLTPRHRSHGQRIAEPPARRRHQGGGGRRAPSAQREGRRRG